MQTLPAYLAFVDKRVAESGGPFVTGKELSVADLSLFSFLHALKAGTFDHVSKDAAAPWPRLDVLYAAVGSHPLVLAHGKLA